MPREIVKWMPVCLTADRADTKLMEIMMTALFAADTTHSARRQVTLARGFNAVSKLYRAFRNRREFYRLGEMSDAELRDIGLVRADLHVAVGQPFGIDPTTRLRSIVEARADAA